jgi:hypothetical protein
MTELVPITPDETDHEAAKEINDTASSNHEGTRTYNSQLQRTDDGKGISRVLQ